MKYFIYILIFFCGIFSAYAQDTVADSSDTSIPEVIEAEPTPEPTPPVVETPKVEATPEATPTEEGEEGDDDKNFGKVFDGASISLSAGMNVFFGDLAAYNLFPHFNQFDDHITAGFKFSIARDIKWGLGGKFNYQRGSLTGTRITGKNSLSKTFENHFFDISLQVRYLLSDALFPKNKNKRFKLYCSAGFGGMWYRTQLYDTETYNTKDFEGYIEVENTEGLAQKTLSDKTAKASSLTIPYGATLIYRYNHKLDLHLDFTQTSTFTDRLDAFDRDWTAKDKYDYIGIGVTYNFNRTSADAPVKRKKKGSKDALDDSSTADNTSTKKRRSRKKKKRKKTDEDELLNIRLKLFETQLKLFEMQYLLGQ